MKKFLCVVLPIIIIVLGISGYVVYSYAYDYAIKSETDTIFQGVHVNDIEVGGLTKEEAKDALINAYQKNLDNKKISITYNDKEYSIGYTELNAHYDIDSAVDKAFEYGKSGNLLERFKFKRKNAGNVHKIELEFKADMSPIKAHVEKIASDIDKAPIDATIKFAGGNFVRTKESLGFKVDQAKLEKDITAAVKPEIVEEKVQVPVETLNPKITIASLGKMDTVISSYRTVFNPNLINRTTNVKLATKAIDGTIIMPGEVYSMNKAIGPRTASKGYKDATIFLNGGTAEALAGGICQVTSTVYNAALLGNFQIVERRAHGLAVSYVPVGRDATIAGNAIDLKFKNTNKYPICIRTQITNSSITVQIIGDNEHPGQSVQLSSEITERISADTVYENDPSLPVGKKVVEQKPVSGMKTVSYKTILQNGKVVSRKVLTKDYYKPITGKVKVGTKKVTPTPAPPKPAVPTVTPSQTPTEAPAEE